ncbi:MAG: transcriptional regulator [Planctomycetota bacterium]
MQLLLPESDLTAIAVEGLSTADQIHASTQTIDIADLTKYFGGNPEFKQANKTTIVQFKYSIASEDKEFRAADAKNTVVKFGKTYVDYMRKYGVKAVEAKLDFQLVTNQPISKSLIEAMDGLASCSSCKGDAERQAKQLEKYSGLSGKPLASFVRKFKLFGRSGNLRETKNELTRMLIDWSATYDANASARLGKLRELVREKAGCAGTGRNLITRTDILGALQIGDPKDLLPCESTLPKVGNILEREQLAEVIARVSNTAMPLLIHATGGVGKTVFMSTLETVLANNYEVVFFDCFGGGAYRSPEDSRHLPKKGVIHIANTLAFRGFCDPILPDNPDVQGLLKTFRRRLIQSLETIRRYTPGKKLALLIDAIDNADIIARRRSEDCFPIKFLECLDAEPIPGVKLIISCRPERKPVTHAKYDEYELRPFSKSETASFMRTRLKNPSEIKINVAHARSGGNPRVLEYLLKEGGGVLDQSEIDKKIELEDLIQKRITDALSAANLRGCQEKDINAFLAGLAVLPPPVPLEEYAGAHTMALDAIKSFSSDLSPFLERTNQGLMFRDEPTETFVNKRYVSSREAILHVATKLFERQDVSVYAARALPGLLLQLNDGEQLIKLAFDDRIPSTITSAIGKRNVRYSRLKSATLHAAQKKDYNSLVRLLLELSTIAAVDERGRDYIRDHPDLIVAAQDMDAMRRLFETKTGWRGARHTRLAIVNTLSGDSDEASRHFHLGYEWIEHYRRESRDHEPRDHIPEPTDIAAIPFFMISQGRCVDAMQYLNRWKDWYAYEICEHIFGYLRLSQSLRSKQSLRHNKFVSVLSSIGVLAAALSFNELSKAKCKDLVAKLANRCKGAANLDLRDAIHRSRSNELQDGLRKSAAIALSLGMKSEAMAISMRVPHKRPNLWAFRDVSYNRDVFPFLFRIALHAAIKNQPVHDRDLLPQELVHICSRIGKDVAGKEFRDKAKERIDKCLNNKTKDEGQGAKSNSLSNESHHSAGRFLSQRLEPLLALTRAFSAVLGSRPSLIDKTFDELIKAWEKSSRSVDSYRPDEIEHFFRLLGFDIMLFAFWFRPELKLATVKRLLSSIDNQKIGAHSRIHIVAILAQKRMLQTLAGEQAIKVRALIEREDEVGYRASLFGALGRAMLPASICEASKYFRYGLEQMDAIGSGDYQFTNELLLFASQMKGSELDEHDFHTLSNICELNIGEEPEKFFWGAYGHGLSRVAGPRGLAKLSRWDDRSKIALNVTLLPYLIGLLRDNKIDAKVALALNRLANPVEHYFSSSKEFAQALRQQAGPDPVVIEELIDQFQDNNPDVAMDDTFETLGNLAHEALGPSSEVARHLVAARACYAKVRDMRNDRNNHASFPNLKNRKVMDERGKKNRKDLKHIVVKTDPIDESSLIKAIDEFNALGNMCDLKGDFFVNLRGKVPYRFRSKYIHNIATLDNLFFYWKLVELKDAKKAWNRSSVALTDIYADLADILINAHSHDLVVDGRLSGSNIKEISDLTGVPIPDLIIKLIKNCARLDNMVPGSVWLAFATLICPESDAGQGQLALRRLLSSEAARLVDSVVDGPWTEGHYPPGDIQKISAGLIWRVFGSPYAVDRWRAAHSLRTFAKFGRWDVIDKVVEKFSEVGAGPFQAKELPFFYMHARLWLLIALARIATDFPAQIARYRDQLLQIVVNDIDPHVLMRHFAGQALHICMSAGHLNLPAKQATCVRDTDRSPHGRLKKRLRKNEDAYSGRPKSQPEPAFQFHLDYDFHKYDVDNLARVFGQQCWKVVDQMAEIVHAIDPKVEAMHDSPGRESRYRHASYEMTTRYQTYGQQLGWHALFIVAGRLLKDYPVTDDSWHDGDPWREWFGRYTLTSNDGLWLSDGTDRTPLDTAKILLERKKNELSIIGDREKILTLINSGPRMSKGLIVDGQWTSADNVKVRISSALVSPQRAAVLARKLVCEEPMVVCVPCLQVDEENREYFRGNMSEYTPWIVCPSDDARLDKHDPYSVSTANSRSYLAHDFVEFCSLSKGDSFGRIWKDARGRPVLSAQAWGREGQDREDEDDFGMRLLCTPSVLKSILVKCNKDLLVLINLQRYERDIYPNRGKYTHTVAVIHVTKALNLKYFKGRVNHLHKMQY